MRIGLDADDVLYPWTARVHAAATKAGVTNGLELEDLTRWDFHQDYGCTSEEFWQVVNGAYVGGMLLLPPIHGVVEVLAEWRKRGHTIHLVTARGFEGHLAPLVRENTITWLRIHGVPHDSLTFSQDKTMVNVDCFLDDSPKNVTALLAAGIPASLMSAPHNRLVEGFDRVETLKEFGDLHGLNSRLSKFLSAREQHPAARLF